MEPTSGAVAEKRVPLHTDKIVWRLDEFPDLLQALRDGDLLAGRLFCAQLFNLNARRSHVDEMKPALRAATKSLYRLCPTCEDTAKQGW
jgi:hypothetical protein